MKKNIYILSGKIQSGKTTRLFEFIRQKKSVAGMLAPVVNGKRCLYDISTQQLKILETENTQSPIISVGNYNFLVETFEWGKRKLLNDFKKEPEWLIIDEIGKLELNNKGLEPAVSEILNSNKNNTKIIIVVRDYLVNDVLKKYNLKFKKINI